MPPCTPLSASQAPRKVVKQIPNSSKRVLYFGLALNVVFHMKNVL